MAASSYRYVFDRAVPFDEVHDTLHLALMAVESMHGRTRVRLDCSLDVDEDAHAVAIDASSPMGQQLNEIFSGYIAREFGDDAFVVQHLVAPPSPQPSVAAAP